MSLIQPFIYHLHLKAKGEVLVKKKNVSCSRRSARHYCKTHAGWNFFLQCLKNPSCEVDWSTETSRCSNCGALLRPPQALLVYCYLGRWWPGVLVFSIGVIVAKLQGIHYAGFILAGALPCFLVTNVIPAVLAATGTWSTFSEMGYTEAALLEHQRQVIQKRRNSRPYSAVMILITIVLITTVSYMIAIAS